MAAQAARAIKKRSLTHSNFWGYFFIMPTLVGLAAFYFGPMIFSLVISFFKWEVVTRAEFIGFGNFVTMFRDDDLIGKALLVTLYYTGLTVPLVNVAALFIASLLNTKIRGKSFFRTINYIPSIVPAVASSALWMFLFNPTFGFFNTMLGWFGLDPQLWIYDTKLVIPSLALMTVWGAGNTIIIYLAGLQGVPNYLYESVEIDGGNAFHKFFHITLPMMSPIVFFNLVINFISFMQTFTQGYIMTQGGPANASLFYVLLLYRNAFKYQKMGYASAMAWLLFAIVALLTFINFRTSNLWVFQINAEEQS